MLAKSAHTCTYSFRSMLNTFTRRRRVVRHFFLMSRTLLDACSGELVLTSSTTAQGLLLARSRLEVPRRVGTPRGNLEVQGAPSKPSSGTRQLAATSGLPPRPLCKAHTADAEAVGAPPRVHLRLDRHA